MWIATSNLFSCHYIHRERIQFSEEKITCMELFWDNAAQRCGMRQLYLFNTLLYCVCVCGGVLSDYCCLINKRTFSYHFPHAWAAVARLLLVSFALPSSLGCIGVIRVSALGCHQASRSERPESLWTRQKCSGAPANTLPPWPSVDGPFLP